MSIIVVTNTVQEELNKVSMRLRDTAWFSAVKRPSNEDLARSIQSEINVLKGLIRVLEKSEESVCYTSKGAERT